MVLPETLPITVQMDIYRKSEVLVFAEGSSCHGVELLGTDSMRRCYLLGRRPRLTGRFEQILRPRAAEFSASEGHHFIGTKYEARTTQEPIQRQGVLLFHVRELVEFFRSHGIASLSTFDEKEYFAAAEADLWRYQNESTWPRANVRDTTSAGTMLEAFQAAKAAAID